MAETAARDESRAPARNWVDRLIDGLATLCGVMLVALVVIVCIDATGRTMTRMGALGFQGYSLAWSLDVAEYMLYAITFLGAPWVLREGGHIAIDMFVQYLNESARRWAVRMSNAIGLIVSMVLFYYACRIWLQSFRQQVLVHETFVFPEWWLLSLAPPVFLLLAVVFLRTLRRPVRPAQSANPF